MIYLDENYRLVNIPNNIIIESKSSKLNDNDNIEEEDIIDSNETSNKKRIWKVQGYFPNIESALRFYINDKIGEFIGGHDVVTDLKTIIDKTAELKHHVNNLFNKEVNNG